MTTRKEPPPYTPAAESDNDNNNQYWYTSSHSCNKLYLQCLLSAETLWPRGISEIHHGRKLSYYEQLLSGKQRNPVGRTLDDDDDEAGPRRALDDDDEAGPLALADEGSTAGDSSAGKAEGETLEDLLEEEVVVAMLDADRAAVEAARESETGETLVGDMQLVAMTTVTEADGAASSRQTRPQGVSRRLHEKSIRGWGAFDFTYIPPNKQCRWGAWQATCPFHRTSRQTKCTKRLNVAGPEQRHEGEALLRLKVWANQAKMYNRKSLHAALDPKALPQPVEAVVEAQKLCEKPADKPKTDAQLDAEQAGAAALGSDNEPLEPEPR
eukprot:5162612-Amphidinium_carterae.1